MSKALPSSESSEEKTSNSSSTPSPGEAQVLETDVPLSQSLIWRLQREFYEQRSLKVWTEDRVPEYITNNPFIAEIYSRIVFNFLSECMIAAKKESRLLTKDHPLRLLELGAGHGKFCFLFLRQMCTLLQERGIPAETVHYYMTDCAEASIESWRANKFLAKFVDAGMLEFELLQVGERLSDAVRSKLSGSPLIVIASYVFDSLPQDAFVIENERIFEALVTTTRTKTDQSSAGGTLSDLHLSYRNVPISPDRYQNETWNRILERYGNQLPAATVLFPCEALTTLQELSGICNGRMLVLAADKGYAHEEDLSFSQGPPTLEFHAANCFSQMVNFDAIGKYFQAFGGEALLPDKHFTGLSLCGFLQGRQGDEFPETKKTYKEIQEAFGPDDLFTLFAWLNAHMEEMSVTQILAALRLTRWDPMALMRFFPVLARQLRSVSAERQDLRNAVMRTWANHYPLKSDENVLAFQCGVILLELRFYEDASAVFGISEQIFGRSAPTSYNKGLCALGMKRPSEALTFMVEACERDPSFEPAKLARVKLEAESKTGQ